ncbi:MAG TPA: hypothetical protein PKN33_11275 [Phycisphaerae bacterium]|nr:hypothetical protein [Phycisphaerae bacterium]
MRIRIVHASFAFVLIVASSIWADELILKDGQVIEGEAEREDDVWTIVTKDGETKTFDKSEVRRHVFESRVTPLEAAAKMKEFVELVEPTLFAPEPQQYIWSRAISEHAGRYSYRTKNASVFRRDRARVKNGQYQFDYTRGGNGSASKSESTVEERSESKVLRDKGIDAVFVDEWARYIAYFERLEEDLLYEELTSRRKYSGSLAEFAMWPPKGYEQQAEAVKRALDAMDDSIELAKTTHQLVQAIPINHRKLKEAVTKAKSRVARAESKVDAADQSQKKYRKNDLTKAKGALSRAEGKLENDIPKASRVAEKKINDFARRREVAIGAIVRAAEEIGAIYTEEPADNSDLPEATSLTLSDAIEKATRQIENHRANSKDLAPLGRDTLRSRTHGRIREIFTGRKFTMRLFVKSNSRLPEGGYELVAEDRAEGQGDTRIRTSLRFDESFLSELAMCRIDTGVAIEASVQDVRFEPSLEDLESSSIDPVFVLDGTIVSVDSGCG